MSETERLENGVEFAVHRKLMEVIEIVAAHRGVTDCSAWTDRTSSYNPGVHVYATFEGGYKFTGELLFPKLEKTNAPQEAAAE